MFLRKMGIKRGWRALNLFYRWILRQRSASDTALIYLHDCVTFYIVEVLQNLVTCLCKSLQYFSRQHRQIFVDINPKSDNDSIIVMIIMYSSFRYKDRVFKQLSDIYYFLYLIVLSLLTLNRNMYYMLVTINTL